MNNHQHFLLKKIVLAGMFIGLVAASTMAVQIPMPLTDGYIHLGDSVILLIAVFWGKKYGGIAGGLGSALADLLTGYAHWAPFTLVIKALMGYFAGSLSTYSRKKTPFFSLNTFLATLAGCLIMIGGYLAGGTLLKGSLAVALTSLPGNGLQGLMGGVLFFIIGKAFDKTQLSTFLHKI